VIGRGPNGAGKTTFARNYLTGPRAHFAFVNADEIARDTAHRGVPQQQADIRAARVMLERIDDLVAVRADFAFETTLATRSYAQKIPIWRQLGYGTSLIYLRLPSIETSIERVRRRVRAGGHGIPEETIRRRFGTSAAYFENLYKSIVDRWYIWDSMEGDFTQATHGNANETDIRSG
jgi:predicted ABC-type ATPase